MMKWHKIIKEITASGRYNLQQLSEYLDLSEDDFFGLMANRTSKSKETEARLFALHQKICKQNQQASLF